MAENTGGVRHWHITYRGKDNVSQMLRATVSGGPTAVWHGALAWGRQKIAEDWGSLICGKGWGYGKASKQNARPRSWASIYCYGKWCEGYKDKMIKEIDARLARYDANRAERGSSGNTPNWVSKDVWDGMSQEQRVALMASRNNDASTAPPTISGVEPKRVPKEVWDKMSRGDQIALSRALKAAGVSTSTPASGSGAQRVSREVWDKMSKENQDSLKAALRQQKQAKSAAKSTSPDIANMDEREYDDFVAELSAKGLTKTKPAGV